MTEEAEQQNKKRSVRISPYFYVCMGAGIVIMSMVVDEGDSILVAGLVCGAGALLGCLAFYIIRWCVTGHERTEKDDD